MNDLLSGQGGPEPRTSERSDTTATCNRRITGFACRELRQLLGSSHASARSPPTWDRSPPAKAAGRCQWWEKGRTCVGGRGRSCPGAAADVAPASGQARSLVRPSILPHWSPCRTVALGCLLSFVLAVAPEAPVAPEDPAVLPRGIGWAPSI